MKLLLENNERRSRVLFLCCVIVGLLLSPLVLGIVERRMDALNPHSTTNHDDPNSTQWDLRSMWN